jgi:hypoxanthine phosphoribosyltransferase
VNLLILDDFVDTGDSLKAIVDFLLKKDFQRDKIKTATVEDFDLLLVIVSSLYTFVVFSLIFGVFQNPP